MTNQMTNGVTNQIKLITEKYPKEVRNYGITEVFEVHGELHTTSMYGLPSELVTEFEEFIKNISNMQTEMTVRQIRMFLFATEKYTVIGSKEMTNKESRDYLYAKEDQEEVLNVIDNNSHLLIW